MKYILSSFGINNPYIAADIPDHAVYPIGLEGDDFIDLDYSLLLVGTGFLFDQSALEYLIAEQSRLPFLSPLVNSIVRLKQEGLLETFDGRAIIELNRAEICKKTEQLCEDTVGWLEPIRSQWKVLKADRDAFLQKFGTKERRQINEHHFSVANAVTRIDGTLNPTLLKEITALIDSRRRTFSNTEASYIKEVLRPLVCHTIIQDLVRFKTAGSVLDWDDSQPYYERLYAARWDRDVDCLLAHHTRSLFTFSLPELRPKSVDTLIKFVRDNRNVSELRTDVASILGRGDKCDEALGKRIIHEVLRSHLAIQHKMKKFRLLGAALSVLVPGGSLLTEAAIEGATMTGEDLVEKKGLRRSHRWFYSLTGGGSGTQANDQQAGRKWWQFWR